MNKKANKAFNLIVLLIFFCSGINFQVLYVWVNYLPSEDTKVKTIPQLMNTNYELYVSKDNVRWEKVDQGEFPNIKNNPVWQIKSFPAVQARFIKLSALKNIFGDNVAGYAEMDVITK